MNVDDAAREGIDEEVGDEGQEACEDDEVDAELLQEWQDDVRFVELRLGHNGRRHAQPLGALKGVGISTIAHNECRADAFRALKVADYVFAVGAAARHEDGDIDQSLKFKV